MTYSAFPVCADTLLALARQHGTPLWVYHADTIRQRIGQLRSFDTVRYAQKANSNTHLLKLMRAEGVKVDAVSLGEVERALVAGFVPSRGVDSEVVFTADVLDRPTLKRVAELGLPVNAGSVDMLQQLATVSPGHAVWLRINPGFGHGHSNKTNTGGEHSKHGIWHEDLAQALALVDACRLELLGLHMHIGSGVDYSHLQAVGQAMVDLAARTARPLQAISAGGGLSVPYRAGEPSIDTAHYFSVWDAARRQIAARQGSALHLEIEPGRFLVAQSGVLLAEVRATKRMGQNPFLLVDAGFNELMRPSMYGSHHEIEVLAHDGGARPRCKAVVAGPLCESGDVFTQGVGGVVLQRELPQAEVGDLLVFRDAGAYGASMSSNYNSRPHAAEVLVDGSDHRLIRRRQSIQELLVLEQC